MLICKKKPRQKCKHFFVKTPAVIHLNLSLEKFSLEPINANIVVYEVRLIGFSPPCIMCSIFIHAYIFLIWHYTHLNCTSVALLISMFHSRSFITHSSPPPIFLKNLFRVMLSFSFWKIKLTFSNTEYQTTQT